jgi:KUP system potassium uptake protein
VLVTKLGHVIHTHMLRVPAAPLQTTWAALAPYASLGIIYVDIGTSPLYTYATTLASSSNNSSSPLHPAKEDVLGVASLIFWIMTLVVLVKYVLIVLRADDSGEGGRRSCSC